MAYKVSVNVKSQPKGELIAIAGIGAIPNGDSITIDEATAKAFSDKKGKTVSEFFKNNKTVSVTTAKAADVEGGEE